MLIVWCLVALVAAFLVLRGAGVAFQTAADAPTHRSSRLAVGAGLALAVAVFAILVQSGS